MDHRFAQPQQSNNSDKAVPPPVPLNELMSRINILRTPKSVPTLFLLVCVGCQGITQAKREPIEIWLSTEDWKACESIALTAAKTDFPALRVDEQGTPIVEIHDWQAMELTVFIPVAKKEDKTYLSYSFRSTTPYSDDLPDVYYFAQQGPKEFKITGKKLCRFQFDGIRRVGRMRSDR